MTLRRGAGLRAAGRGLPTLTSQGPRADRGLATSARDFTAASLLTPRPRWLRRASPLPSSPPFSPAGPTRRKGALGSWSLGARPARTGAPPLREGTAPRLRGPREAAVAGGTLPSMRAATRKPRPETAPNARADLYGCNWL